MIIDDFGMEPLDEMSRMMLLEIIEDRHQNSSTIVASQLPLEKWYDVIGKALWQIQYLTGWFIHLTGSNYLANR